MKVASIMPQKVSTYDIQVWEVHHAHITHTTVWRRFHFQKELCFFNILLNEYVGIAIVLHNSRSNLNQDWFNMKGHPFANVMGINERNAGGHRKTGWDAGKPCTENIFLLLLTIMKFWFKWTNLGFFLVPACWKQKQGTCSLMFAPTHTRKQHARAVWTAPNKTKAVFHWKLLWWPHARMQLHVEWESLTFSKSVSLIKLQTAWMWKFQKNFFLNFSPNKIIGNSDGTSKHGFMLNISKSDCSTVQDCMSCIDKNC